MKGGHQDGGRERPRRSKTHERNIHIGTKHPRDRNGGTFEELRLEMKNIEPGTVLLSETWPKDPKETFRLGEWTFLGTGQARARGTGTAVLIHQSIEIQKGEHISARATSVRVKVGKGYTTVVSIYGPHSGHSQTQWSNFMNSIKSTIKKASESKDMVIIGGDWNVRIPAKDGSKNDRKMGSTRRWGRHKPTD